MHCAHRLVVPAEWNNKKHPDLLIFPVTRTSFQMHAHAVFISMDKKVIKLDIQSIFSINSINSFCLYK